MACALQALKSKSRSPISLSDESSGGGSSFQADDSDEESMDSEWAASPEPVSRAYQAAVKNRALKGNVETIQHECAEPKYQQGELP